VDVTGQWYNNAMPDLRRLALEFPETHEKLTWGDHPTFRVRDKIFAILSDDESSVRLKATKEAQSALVASDPETFFVPPYVGRHGWVGVNLDRVDAGELDELLEEAWRLTAPKKMVRAFDETAI
jgi:hypothetical protein